MKKNNAHGFTMIEMAIVLVVIGFLAATVILGQTVVQSYRTTSVISKLKSYKNAYDLFKTNYNAVPGDIVDAKNLFGTNDTENGNGNWAIDDVEPFYAWQHLALAKFIDGNFPVTTTVGATADDNSPAGPQDGSIFYFGYIANGNSYNGNVIYYGRPDSYALAGNYGTLSPADAYAIDSKLDDGIYNTGTINSDCHYDVDSITLSQHNAEEKGGCNIYYITDKLSTTETN